VTHNIGKRDIRYMEKEQLKLKTLKDLQKDLEWKFDTYMALRQAAIGWVKHLDKWDKTEFCQISWIMHFFNLNEEDLK